MREQNFPARLHILIAKDQRTAVVIRRGPSKQTASFLWDLHTDEITLGQWLNGRIYERRSDISPDGKFWIYFAMNGNWDSEVRGSWTAVARTPWLKAESLYAKGDCWHGGGIFKGTKTFWLNGCGHLTVNESKDLTAEPDYPVHGNYGGECPSVYYNRLQRDGWTLVERNDRNRLDAVAVFEKPLPGGRTLRKICREQIGAPKGKGCYWDSHAVVSADGSVDQFPDWEWAELIAPHIAYARHGCLYSIAADDLGGSDGRLIHDFNPYKFEARESPY